MRQPKLSFGNELERLLGEDISSTIEREKLAFDQSIEQCNNSIVIFGAGNLGRQVSAQLRKEGIEPLGFADNNPNNWGKHIDGIKVYSPKDAAENFGATASFLVTIWNAQVNHQFKETKKMLISLNCQNVISFVSFMWKYSDVFLPNCSLDLPHKIIEEKAEVENAFKLWSDTESQETYISQLKWRMLDNFDSLKSSTFETQYFPDFLELASDETFVDCGAYNGDTIKEFLSVTKNNFKEIHAFEPDVFNFNTLSEYIQSLSVKQSVCLYQNAVGISAETLMFQATGTASSSLSTSGTIAIESVPLDSVLKFKCPSFIKMDIEGAEIEALLGAKNILKTFTPVLAICVYHKQNHLWKIPQLIASLSDSYQFFLRAHREEGWDLVCYAIPSNRIKNKKS